MAAGLGAALLAAAVFGVAAVLQATAVRRLPAIEGGRLGPLLTLLRQPLFVTAVALNLLGFVLHFVSLRLIPLYLSQAVISSSLAFTAVLAVVWLGERLRATDWLAVAAVTAGLAALALASGDIGEKDGPAWLVPAILGFVALAAVTGLVLSRWHRGVAAFGLGALAGIGFAGSGLAARLLPGYSVGDLWDSLATYVLPFSGGTAFVLYSLGLQRASVTVSTAPMIVMQTVVPAVVGIALLGDGVREGRWPLGLAGMAVAVAGAVALARFERGPNTAERA